MKIKSKPKKPYKQKAYQTCSIYDGQTLKEVIDYFTKLAKYDEVEIDVNELVFQIESDYYDSYSISAAIKVMESDKKFALRMEKYKERLAEYEMWYKDNKKEIEIEMDRRKREILEKQKQEQIKAKVKAEKELERLNKKLGG